MWYRNSKVVTATMTMDEVVKEASWRAAEATWALLKSGMINDFKQQFKQRIFESIYKDLTNNVRFESHMRKIKVPDSFYTELESTLRQAIQSFYNSLIDNFMAQYEEKLTIEDQEEAEYQREKLVHAFGETINVATQAMLTTLLIHKMPIEG